MHKKSVFNTPWFEIISDSTQSEKNPYYYIKTFDYVTIVATTPSGDFLLVKQHRPALGKETWELPAGHVDPGETPIEAARRELIEETGHDSKNIEALGPVLSPDTGRMSNKLWCFFAKDVFKVKDVDASNEEGISWTKMSPQEVAKMAECGELGHALNTAPLYYGALKGKYELPF